MQQELIFSDDLSLQSVFLALLKSFELNAQILKNCSSGSKFTKTQNEFGDEQLEADVLCEKNIILELSKTTHVSHYASEETPEMKLISETGQYIVTFDPLDGSSIIGTNFTVGTIVGIWKSDDKLLIGQQGKDLISSICCLYGSRTTAFIYNVKESKVYEYTLFDTHGLNWQLSKDDIQIKKKGKLFAPGNIRCTNDYPAYKELLDYWISNGYTLRYTGGMAPDICQIFIKGEGIFTSFGTQKHPAKLRYLYETAPLAFLIEKAGGLSTNGKESILNLYVNSYTEKTELAVGSQDEINYLLSIWNKHGLN
ncbi:hypothetical protein pb186bvf_001950 [Paramecium bursaria]